MGSATDVGTDSGGLTSDAAWVETGTADVELTGQAQSVAARRPAYTGRAASEAFASRRRWAWTLTVITFAVDVGAIALGYLMAKALHDHSLPVGPTLLHQIDTVIFLTIPAWPVVFALYGLYDLRRPTHATAELQRLFHAVVMCVLLVVFLSFAERTDWSRSFVVALLLFCLVTTIGGRLMIRRVSHALNSRAITSQRTVIAGSNDEARAIARTLRRRRWMGYDVRGFIEVRPSGLDVIDGLPVFGSLDEIGEITSQRAISAVIVAGSAAGGATLQQIDAALAADITVRVSPGLPNLGASRVVMEPIDGMALFSLRRHRFSRRQRLLKRGFDLSIALGIVVVTAPVMAVVALLVRLSGPGPVLFRQHRVGVDERDFVMYKFRTMVVDAEDRRDGLGIDNEADGPLFKMRHDPRVTRIGHILRRFSLDELPQLFNVLRGEMSLVGPRPALPEETTRYAESWRGRLRVKPGLTGLWQVNGRHDLAFEDYLRYDLFYVENWSLTMDLYILAKTLPALVSSRGSY